MWGVIVAKSRLHSLTIPDSGSTYTLVAIPKITTPITSVFLV